uniref:Transcriptional regulator n=2 Tax=Actinomycetes TaxID=1760 RepID=B6EUL1_9MICO|nr:transcriptional regulator [Rhodococcus sp. YK2]BAG80725.1 transcriptional regulator [Terrabacter sp. YK3]
MSEVATSSISVERLNELGEPWSLPGCPVPLEVLQEVRDTVRAMQFLVLQLADPDVDEVVDVRTATAALSRVWQLAIGAIDAGQPDAGVESRRKLLEVLGRVRNVEARLREAQARERERASDFFQQTMSELENTESTEALLQRATEVVCGIGFDRAIASTLQDGMWFTNAVCIPTDEAWATEILRVGGAHPQKVSSLFESVMIRGKKAICVTAVSTDERIHRPLADVSRVHSYVAAPILQKGLVVGFLHADRYFQRRYVGEPDRRLLTQAARSVSHLWQRNALLDRLGVIQSGLASLSDTATGAADGYADITMPPPAGGVGRANSFMRSQLDTYPRQAVRFAPASSLSTRESEVLRLMAAGETNSAIAARLFVTDETVKSHVKQILRKLHARNRAEAVAKWLA